uniref:lysozyme n=1 Tax=Anopheles christyi TaxID=43041 RepID=A0A182JR07_9DIPT
MRAMRHNFRTVFAISVVVILFTLYSIGDGKVYEKCSLARTLDRQRISSRTLISNYFLNDDLTDDVECAKQIYNDSGFAAWKGWVNRCKQKTLPDLLDKLSHQHDMVTIQTHYLILPVDRLNRSEYREWMSHFAPIITELATKSTMDTKRVSVRRFTSSSIRQILPWAIVSMCLISLPSLIHAKIYTKCELAKQLTANGISRTYQGHWICLAMAVSGLDSSKTTTLPNQTANYGIFQINSKDWCRVGYKGGKYLVTDNITNAIKCSKIIQQQNGFNEWVMWQKKCKGKDLPDITNCGAIG